MRVPAAISVFVAIAAVTAAGAAPAGTGNGLRPGEASRCPSTTSYLADQAGRYQGKPLTPKKLTELPPATAFMAVYRRIGRCEAPLTMVEYRSRRPR